MLLQISNQTQDMLVEVTSSESLGICKEVMDSFLMETLQLGIGRLRPRPTVSSIEFPTLPGAVAAKDEMSKWMHELNLDEGHVANVLVVEQCRVFSEEENLKVCYPSKTDLAIVAANTEVHRKF